MESTVMCFLDAAPLSFSVWLYFFLHTLICTIRDN